LFCGSFVPCAKSLMEAAHDRSAAKVLQSPSATHVPRSLLTYVSANISPKVTRYRASSSSSMVVPPMTASRGHVEMFARAVLEELETADGSIAYTQNASVDPMLMQQLASAPRLAVASMGSGSSCFGASLGRSPHYLLSRANSGTQLPKASSLAAIAASLPDGLAAHQTTPSRHRLQRVLAANELSRTRLDERLLRLESLSQGMAKTHPQAPTFEEPRYIVAHEVERAERQEHHRHEIERQAKAASQKSPDAAMVAARAATAPVNVARACVSAQGGIYAGRLAPGGILAASSAELALPGKAAPRARPMTGLEQCEQTKGIGHALAAPLGASAGSSSRRLGARPATRGGGFAMRASDRSLVNSGTIPLPATADAPPEQRFDSSAPLGAPPSSLSASPQTSLVGVEATATGAACSPAALSAASQKNASNGVGTLEASGTPSARPTVERISDRGMLPVRISRRWAHMAPSTGRSRKQRGAHEPPPPWTPFLRPMQHVQSELLPPAAGGGDALQTTGTGTGTGTGGTGGASEDGHFHILPTYGGGEAPPSTPERGGRGGRVSTRGGDLAPAQPHEEHFPAAPPALL
jgi:hypothetical protein